MHLDTLGLTNGCIDEPYQSSSYPQILYNNTYGVEFITRDVYEDAMHNFTKLGGCRDLIVACRELGALSDPDELGINATVNEACVNALGICTTEVQGAFPQDVSMHWALCRIQYGSDTPIAICARHI